MAAGVPVHRASAAPSTGFAQTEGKHWRTASAVATSSALLAAQARAQGDRAVDGGIEAAEMHAAFAELREHPLDVIRPTRGGVGPKLADPELFRPGKGRGDELDSSIRAAPARWM